MLLLSLVLGAGSASCSKPEVALLGARWSPPVAASFRAEWRAEADAARCLLEQTHIEVSWVGSAPLEIIVTWQHHDTEQRLRRLFDARGLPAEGLPLALSAVVSELLNEARSVQAAADARVGSSVEPATYVGETPRTVGVFARLVGQQFANGATSAGADAVVRWAPVGRHEAEVFIGGRGVLARAGPLGSASMAGLCGGLGYSFRVVEFGRWALHAQVVGEVTRWWARATPLGQASTRAPAGYTISARGGLELSFRPGSTWWALGLGAGAPVLGFEVTDGQQPVLTLSGFQAALTLGAGVSW